MSRPLSLGYCSIQKTEPLPIDEGPEQIPTISIAPLLGLGEHQRPRHHPLTLPFSRMVLGASRWQAGCTPSGSALHSSKRRRLKTMAKRPDKPAQVIGAAVGGAIGGVVGVLIGGPVGAAVGAAIGSSSGDWIAEEVSRHGL